MSIDFVKMIPKMYSQRYWMQINNLINSKIPSGFFCGGSVSNNLRGIIENIRNNGVNLTCILVIDESHKELIDDINLPVLTINDLPQAEIKVNLILYMNDYFDSAFFSYFQRYGIDMLPLIDFNSREMMFNFYTEHLADLYSVHEMLSDEESKEYFRSYIMGKLSRRVSNYKFAPESQYFFEGFFPIEGDIVIDGGAYDGATARDFTMQGAKVYAFEMSNENYPKCLERAEKYNFVVENIGLSNREGKERYIESGTGSRKGGGYCDSALY